MKVLVQYEVTGISAAGIWWVDEQGDLKNLYVDPDGPEAARGRLLVYGKTNPDVPWGVWFDQLADRPPYFEVWAVYDSMGFTPQEMLSACSPVSASA